MTEIIDYFFFSSRRRHTRSKRDWSSDVCSSDLDHAVDLGRRKSRLLGGIQAGQHPAQVAAAGDVAEGLRIEGIEADIEALYSGPPQIGGHLRQPQAVGGQGEMSQSGDR